MEIDLNKIKKIHFVGIKGIAMAAIAVYCKERGFFVTGSDVSEEFPSDEVLRKAKISYWQGFGGEHIKKAKPDLVIYTGAHGGRENIEVVEALTMNIPVLPHGKALGLFMEGKRQISVAGSHGKTTTTAMIAAIMNGFGLDASFAVGSGEIGGLGLPGHFGKGDWFIAEADEYVTDPGHDQTPRFLWQSPEILVVTNIDYDHPDVYPSLESVINAFEKFRDKVPHSGELIASADDPNSKRLVSLGSSVATVGLSASSDYHVTHVHFSEGRTMFELQLPDVFIGEFILQVPGRHNAVNAAMAAVASYNAGVGWDEIRKQLYEFKGAKRRFEKIGEKDGVLFYDDYAHHPHEIRATLEGARLWFPKRRIISVFQPHTYSRTYALHGEFAKSFGGSDVVVLTDIYASAREHETMGITGSMLAEEAATYNKDVHFAKDSQAVYELLKKILTPSDIIIFMGAGDIYSWGKEIVKQFTNPTRFAKASARRAN